MTFCPNCGATLNKSDKSGKDFNPRFCPECGLDLNASPEHLPADELERRIVDLLRQNKLVDAIALRRAQSTSSLKESKNFVEEIARRNGLENALRVPLKSRLIGLFILSLFLGLLVSLAGIALFPQVGLVTKPLLCKGQLRLEATEYSGSTAGGGEVRKVSKKFYCESGEEVTRTVTGLSIVCYTGIFFIFSAMAAFIRHALKRD